MSQQPPPPPYGGPPGQPSAARTGPPPGPAAARRGMSNKAKFWIGVLLALPALVVGRRHQRRRDGSGRRHRRRPVGGRHSSRERSPWPCWSACVLMIVLERTRWIALGMLAGTAILFVLAAGACVALLVGLLEQLQLRPGSDSYGRPARMGGWAGCE